MFTWIIEHTLLLLPTWFWFVIAGAGAVLYFLSGFISALPQLKAYGSLVKILGGVLLLGGVYLTGGAGILTLWKEEVAKMEEKVKIAEEKSKQANEDLAKSLAEKKGKTKETQVIIQERIQQIEKRIDAECKIEPEVVSILNDAAKNQGGKK